MPRNSRQTSRDTARGSEIITVLVTSKWDWRGCMCSVLRVDCGLAPSLPVRTKSHILRVQIDYDRGVVRRALEPAWRRIYLKGRAFVRERRGQQHVVDAQAEVAAKRAHAVVPPGEGLRRPREQREGILQAGVEQGAKRRALGLRAQHLAVPRDRVVHVGVGWSDVVV